MEEINHRLADRSNIIFLPGFIEDDRLQIFLNASDLVALPYRDILTSGTAYLAMAFAKPVLIPNIGCIPETLDENGAFFFDPTNPIGLEKALRKALTDSGSWSEKGLYNYKLGQTWGWSKVARDTLSIYRGALRS